MGLVFYFDCMHSQEFNIDDGGLKEVHGFWDDGFAEIELHK